MGDSEKQVKALFSQARKLAPSVIFIDEVDSLMGTRSDASENSIRFKSELLVEMDGIRESPKVLVLGATNAPWDIDSGFIRRLQVRPFRIPEEHRKH